MITIDRMHSENLECKESMIIPVVASLFPTLSFSPFETLHQKAQTEEIVWIKGTVTVSF